MNVSILVSNFGRARLFARSLETIKPQLIDGDEIVVADDSTVKDGIEDVLKQSGIRYQYADMKNTGYRSGVRAKNVALRMCRNELVIINDPEVLHVTMNISIIRKRFESGDTNIFLVPGTMYFSKVGQEDLSDVKDMAVINHSMAPFIGGVLRKNLIAVGGWDERFVFWGNDDNDLMGRLVLSGVSHVVDDAMVAVHQWHTRQPQSANGDYNEPLLNEKPKKIVANEGKEWGKI